MSSFSNTKRGLRDEIIRATGASIETYRDIMDNVAVGRYWSPRFGIDRDAYEAVQNAINELNEAIEIHVDATNTDGCRTRDERHQQIDAEKRKFEEDLQERLD
jgi:hypothetical protein